MSGMDLAAIPGAVYSRQDEAGIASQMKSWWIFIGVYGALFAAAVVCSLLARTQWMTMAVTILLGGVLIFMWGLKIAPVVGYKRHLREIREGLCRTAAGSVTRFDGDVTFREGIECRAMIINIGETGDPKDERLFYWDAAKPAPGVKPGDKVEITAHGNDIIGFAVSG